MHHTTGFDRDEIIDLCVLINSCERDPDFVKWPPILGLFKSVTVTLTYMRHNRTQAEIGESFGVSQPTISRAIKVITPLIADDLAGYVPTADELDPGTRVKVKVL
jgi:Helix-turn-helix of DDE superfamily endonuclease